MLKYKFYLVNLLQGIVNCVFMLKICILFQSLYNDIIFLCTIKQEKVCDCDIFLQFKIIEETVIRLTFIGCQPRTRNFTVDHSM